MVSRRATRSVSEHMYALEMGLEMLVLAAQFSRIYKPSSLIVVLDDAFYTRSLTLCAFLVSSRHHTLSLVSRWTSAQKDGHTRILRSRHDAQATEALCRGFEDLSFAEDFSDFSDVVCSCCFSDFTSWASALSSLVLVTSTGILLLVISVVVHKGYNGKDSSKHQWIFV